MKPYIAIATLVLSLVSTAAYADTRSDFISNPEAYAALSVTKGMPSGHVVTFDIPVNASLLGATTATSVSGGRILASSIAYARPIASLKTPLGMAVSPVERH
jgi:hypothetical protein